MTKPLQGILPALVTPFSGDDVLNAGAIEALLQRVYECGSAGVYVCGQTGEGLLMPVPLREQAAEVVIRNSPSHAQVIVHVGASNTADAVHLARHAARNGATAISSLAPAGPFSFDEIRAYYADLAAAVDLPVLVYYFPEVAPSIRTLDQIMTLCSIPGVAGLKFTDFDLYRMAEIRRAGHVIFNGRDEVLAAGLLMGANGGIGTFYNLAPKTFVDIQKVALSGDWAQARALQDQINRLITITLRYPLFPAVKRILTWSGIDAGTCLAPRVGITDDQWSRLQRELTDAGFTPEHFARGVAA